MISVVIPHLNQHEFLKECLASLVAQSLDADEFEVLVVDNGSESSPEEIVAGCPQARLLVETTPGPGPARNAGVKAARGDIVAFIDADCRADKDWLRSGRARLLASPDKTILGGDFRIYRHPDRPMTDIEAYESVFAYRFQLYIEKHGFSGTGNLVLFRKDFEAIGPFAGISVAEDIEWGGRARAAGYRFLYAPEMVVFHPARRTLRELRQKWARHIQHAVNVEQERGGWRLKWIAKASLTLASPVAGAVTVLRSDRLTGLGARMRAIKVLVAIRAYRAFKMLSLLGGGAAVEWNRPRLAQGPSSPSPE